MEPNSDTKQSCINNSSVSNLFKPPVLSVPVTISAPIFAPVPTAETPTTLNASTATSQSLNTEPQASGSIGSDYVFGSNISSRVVNANVAQGASTNLWTTTSDCGDAAVPSSSMFTTLAKAVTVTKPSTSNGSKNLEDSAKEVIEDKRKETLSLVEVDVVTGEEGERQIVRQHCRAYVFDTDKQKWNSLGASHFHLNDIPDQTDEFTNAYPRSRVVVRLASTRRLIINSLIWSEMPLALVDPRSVRIGAISVDGTHIKSYLFVFPPDQSASQIFEMLNSRKSRATSTSTNSISTAPDSNIISGRKRQSEGQSDGVAQKVPAVSQQATNNASPGVPQFPPSKANIFRPSVLDSTNAFNSRNNNQELASSSYAGGEVQFRNSPLDAVVKRFKETTSSTPECNVPPSTTKASDQVTQSHNLLESKTVVPVTGGTNNPSDFVFGRNISDRVIITSSVNQIEAAVIEPDSTNLRSDCAKSDCNENDESGDFLTNIRTLKESAAAVLEEMREKSIYPLPNLPISSIMTGEEGENLTMKVYCQFYLFDRVKQEWIGRGKAYVHLNDIRNLSATNLPDQSSHLTSGPPARSRLVIRVCQTFKLLANIPIAPGLNLAMADEHSLRLTAFLYSADRNADEKLSNVTQQSEEKPEFTAYLLVMKSNKEAERLYQAILSRLSTFTERKCAEMDKTVTLFTSDDSKSNIPQSVTDSDSSTHRVDSESSSTTSATTN